MNEKPSYSGDAGKRVKQLGLALAGLGLLSLALRTCSEPETTSAAPVKVSTSSEGGRNPFPDSIGATLSGPLEDDVPSQQRHFIEQLGACVEAQLDGEDGLRASCKIDTKEKGQPMDFFNFPPDSSFNSVQCVAYDEDGYPQTTVYLYAGPMIVHYDPRSGEYVTGEAQYVSYVSEFQPTFIVDQNIPVIYSWVDEGDVLASADSFEGVSQGDGLGQICDAGVSRLEELPSPEKADDMAEFFDLMTMMRSNGIVIDSSWGDHDLVSRSGFWMFSFYKADTLQYGTCSNFAGFAEDPSPFACSIRGQGELGPDGVFREVIDEAQIFYSADYGSFNGIPSEALEDPDAFMDALN